MTPPPLSSYPRMLVVDDRPDKILSLVAMLEPLGSRIDTARSGPEALRLLLSAEYAIILLDIQMPGMGGIEAARIIRQREVSAHTPIIFVTALDAASAPLQEAYGLGAVDFLYLPVDITVLRAKVSVFLELHRLRLATAQRLASTEFQLRQIVEGASLVVWATDTEGRLTLSEGKGLAALGLRPGEAVGTPCEDVIGRGTPALACIRRAIAGETFVDEVAIRDRWYRAQCAPLVTDERVTGMSGIMVDITERRFAEERLRSSEEFNRRVIDSSGDCIKVLDLDGHVLSMNEGGMRIMDVSDFEAVRGKNWADFWTATDRTSALEAMATALAGGTGRFQGMCNTIAGVPKWLDVVVTAMLGADGIPERLVSVSRDITAFKQAQDDQKRAVDHALESEQRFRSLADSVPVLIWEAGLDSRCTWFNRSWLAFTGRTMGEEIGDGWTAGVHPEDLHRCLEGYQRAFGAKCPFTMDYRLRTATGPYHWITDHGGPRFAPDGTFLGFIGACFDIHDQKLGQDALIEADAQTKAIIDTALDAVVGIGDDDLITEWNPQATIIFGWTRAQALGQRLAELIIPPDQRAMHLRGMQRLRDGGEPRIVGQRIELMAVRRSGELFPVEVAIVQTPARAGRIHFSGFLRDISSRKRAEASVERLTADLQKRVSELTTILDVIPIGIAITRDPTCEVIEANAVMTDLVRMPPGSNISLSAPALSDSPPYSVYQNGRKFMPSDLPLQRAAAAGELIPDTDFELRFPKGATRQVIISAVPLMDPSGNARGGVAVTVDITERHRQAMREHLLVDASTMLGTSLDQVETLSRLADVVVPRFADWAVIDLLQPDGTLQRLTIAHADADKLAIVREWHNQYPLRDDQAPYMVVRTGRSVFLESVPDEFLVKSACDPEHLRLVRGLGMKSYLVVPLAVNTRMLGAMTLMTTESGRTYTAEDVAFAEDLGRRAAIAIENAQLFGEAERSRQEAAQRADALAASNSELQQFAYIASHDLKEPLRMVTQYMGILNRKLGPELTADHRQFLSYAVDGAMRMQSLITDLLAFTQVGRQEEVFHRIVLTDVIQDVLQLFAERINATKAEVSVGPLPEVLGSKAKLSLVVQNLIGNALKFHHPERFPEIAISGERRGDSWEISIQDNGIGIEPAYHEKIFNVFQRLHGRDEYPGTGMGLAICRKIMEQHHGELLVESQFGVGSRFIICLPMEPRPPSGDTENISGLSRTHGTAS